MKDVSIHAAQAQVLRTLRHHRVARFADLQRQAGMDSDVFKFHIRTLVKHGHLQKTPSGLYALTPAGKEFANNLNEQKRVVQKQPKVSLLMVAERTVAGRQEYLIQTRKRQPHWGYAGFLTGPVLWGVSLENNAQHEFTKQTGLEGHPEVLGFFRQRDYGEQAELLEDKVFSLIRMRINNHEMNDSWPRGKNEWLSVEDLKTRQQIFPNTYKVIDMLNNGTVYTSVDTVFPASDY